MTEFAIPYTAPDGSVLVFLLEDGSEADARQRAYSVGRRIWQGQSPQYGNVYRISDRWGRFPTEKSK